MNREAITIKLAKVFRNRYVLVERKTVEPIDDDGDVSPEDNEGYSGHIKPIVEGLEPSRPLMEGTCSRST